MKNILAALALISVTAIAAPPADLDARVKHDMELYGVPGMAVAVVEDGKIVHAKGYGIREINKKDKVDEHTTFPIASCSKAFTSAALALLVDDGKLSWDDKVIDKMPGFRMYDPFATSEMTVRDLLVHRSGLGLGAGDMLWMGGTDYTRKELVERLRFIKPATSFRSGYAYDNVLYVAAGQLIEAVSGLTWEEFLARRIFKPLGMKDTVASDRDAIKQGNHVSLHARLGGVMRGVGGTMQVLPKDNASVEHNAAPAGAINASAIDMARWMQVQLARGALPDGKRLFSEAQAKEMWTPGILTPESKVPPQLADLKPNLSGYALGWSITDYRGHKIVTHTGAVFGGLAIVMLLPEKNVGVAAMINDEDGGARRAIAQEVIDHYLGLPQRDWAADFKAVTDMMAAKGVEALKALPSGDADAGAPKGTPPLPLEKFAGKYRDPWYGTITISKEGDGLKLQFDHTPKWHAPLEYVRYNTFRTRFADKNIEDAYLTFAIDPDGSIQQIKLKAVSPLADFSFDYQDFLFTPEKKSAP